MDIIRHLYGTTICGLTPLQLIDNLNTKENFSSQQKSLIISFNGKYTPIKCISQIYADPITKLKIKKHSINNPCHTIKIAFGMESNYNDNCKDCHLRMANSFLKGEVSLLKQNS